MLKVDLESLKKAAKDFYSITKMKIVLYDEKRRFLYSYPAHMCRFCEEVRKSKPLERLCLACDSRGFDVCEKTREKHIYTCHMGLTEAICPILENGIIIGYIMLGQVPESQNKSIVIERIHCAADGGHVGREALLRELGGMETVDRAILSSAADMMEMCACYLWLKQIIQVNSYSLAYQLSRYIEEHIAGDLSVKALCRYLSMSRSSLYKLSLSCFGMGISDYIRHRRIEAAKGLFCARPALTVAEVAWKCGIADANYFTKLFKKATAMTPKEYRKALPLL